MRCCTAERCNKSNHPSGSPLNCGRHLNFVTPLGCHCVTPLVFYFVTPLAFTLPRNTARLSPRNTARLPSRDTALRCHVGCARSAGMDDYVPSRRMYTMCMQCTTGDGLVKSPARPRLPQPVVLVVRVMTMHIVLSVILEYFLRDHHRCLVQKYNHSYWCLTRYGIYQSIYPVPGLVKK